MSRDHNRGRTNGNTYLPWAELMRIERLSSTTFESTALAFEPPSQWGGAFGGHVYAQAVWAAAHTLPDRRVFVVHVCM